MDLWWEQLGASWWFYAQMAFTIAMLVHVYRANSEPFWYFVIFFLPPVGAWVYFFAVFVRGFRFGGTGPVWRKRLSLDELRYHADRMPTVNNPMASSIWMASSRVGLRMMARTPRGVGPVASF